MSAVVRTVKNEIQALIAVRKDSIYPSIGRMVWGKHWYLYIVVMLLVMQAFGFLHDFFIRSMMNSPGSYFRYFASATSLLNGITPFFLAIFVWGLIPFTRHQANQAVDDLSQTPVTRYMLYRAFVLHTLGAYAYLYPGKILLSGVRSYLLYDTFKNPWWVYIAPRSYTVSLNPDQYDGFFPLTFYRIVICPLWDLWGHIHSYLGSCIFPVLAVVLLMAYWKRKGLFFVFRRMVYIALIIGVFGFIHLIFIYAILWTQNMEFYQKVFPYLTFVYQAIMWLIWGAILWRVFKTVSKFEPFSEGEEA